jgi:hypothetical protein
MTPSLLSRLRFFATGEVLPVFAPSGISRTRVSLR